MSARNTIQRQLVLSAVQSLRHHPTAEDIYLHVAKAHPTISRGTVYRNLSTLAGEGEIRRVSHLNAADRFDFELRPHYHFYCEDCGQVFDASMDYDHGLLEKLQSSGAFVYKSYDIVFTGLCPHCAEKQNPANTA